MCDGDLDHGCTVGGRMAAALRLIVAFCVLCVGLVGGANATPSDGFPSSQVDTFTYNGSFGPAPGQSVCTALAAYDGAPFANDVYPQTYSSTFVSDGPHAGHCSTTMTYRGNTSQTGDSALTYAGQSTTCDAYPASTATGDGSGGTYCKCTYGVSSLGGSCRSSGAEKTDADCGTAGTPVAGSDDAVLPRQSGGGSCVDGCTLQGSGSVCGMGSCVTYGPYVSTGKACASTSNTSPVGTTEASCTKQGMSYGTVNGVTTCVPAATTSTTTTSGTQSTSASGVSSGGTTTTDSRDNGDGTTTTTTTTTNSDGSHSTTVTTGKTPAGSASGVGGSDASGDTCKLHPNLAMCKVSTFGGSCAASFTCDGDAVQCAIAKEQHERNCTFYDPASANGPVATDYDKFTNARSDGDSPAWSPTNVANVDSQTIDFASGISQTKHFGSQCVQDEALPLTAFNKVVIIHWSDWCPQMQMIGKLVLSVAALVCVGIVFKA